MKFNWKDSVRKNISSAKKQSIQGSKLTVTRLPGESDFQSG